MKAVLDESVPRQLALLLSKRGCDVVAFPNSWKGLKNGALLRELPRAGYDCLVTCDKSLAAQQSLAGRNLSLVVLPDQRLDTLTKHLQAIADAIEAAEPGKVYTVPITK